MGTKQRSIVYFFLPAAIFLGVIGWGGMYLVITKTLPMVGPRWLFFFLIFIAASGTALPIAAVLNLRFSNKEPVNPSVVLRQAIWAGIFITTLSWLQMGRVLTSGLLTLLFLGLVAIEWLLRLRERSVWSPPKDE